jgi:hypothetical protein
MESLESKLDRLTTEQRKEVEDFVDFLVFRSGNFQGSPATPQVSPQIQNVAPPPLSLAEPLHVPENSPPGVYDAPPSGNQSSVGNGEVPNPVLEIVVDSDDRITREYMDYGQFEQQKSPAIAAVKKVKEKLQKREENEKPRVSLDWID